MPFTRTTFIRLLKIVSTVVVAGIIISYAIWRSLNYARGPHVEIFEPRDGSAVTESITTIKGQALRVNTLLVNGKSISINENGDFTYSLIIFPGSNIITFEASDQFGRKISQVLTLVGTVNLPEQKHAPVIIPEEETASTTSSTSTTH